MPREIWNRDDVPPIQYRSASARLRRFAINLIIIVGFVALTMICFAILLVKR